jgi:signal transduction histidine kinase
VDPAHKALAEVIVDESSRLGRIVTEFLDFARPQKPRLRPVTVEEVLERNLQALAPEAARAGVEMKTRFARQRVPVMGDSDMLYRAFLNVLNNAMQVMEDLPEDSLLVVSTRKQTVDGKRWVVTAVDDNGPGFDPETRSRLFDPFFTTREQGAGLGLSIVSNIVAGHEGRVEVGDAPEGGGRVEVWLPALKA